MSASQELQQAIRQAVENRQTPAAQWRLIDQQNAARIPRPRFEVSARLHILTNLEQKPSINQ